MTRDDRDIKHALTTLPERLEAVIFEVTGGTTRSAQLLEAAHELFPDLDPLYGRRKIQRWLATEGRRRLPSAESLVAIGIRYGTDLDWLLLGDRR